MIEEINQSDEKVSLTKEVKEILKLLVSSRMLYFMPIIIWKALSQAAFNGSFVPLINDTMQKDHPDQNDNKKLSMSLFAMIPLGIGEIIGALLMGNLRDKFGYQTTLKILLPATLVAFAMVFGTIASYSFNTLSFLMTFVWGFQDSSLNIFINCILAFEFDSKVVPFSAYNFA